jgi:hypothetical protein
MVLAKFVCCFSETSSLTCGGIKDLNHASLKLRCCYAFGPAHFIINFDAVFIILTSNMILDFLGIKVHELVHWDHIMDITQLVNNGISWLKGMSLVNSWAKFSPEPSVHQNDAYNRKKGENDLSNERYGVATALLLRLVKEIETTTHTAQW